MKKPLLKNSLAVLALASIASTAGAAVSVSIGEPGFYGRIDIGGAPAPQIIYPEPVVIHRAPGVVYEPVYLHVPPGHEKRWSRYCGRYNACGRPVYFVRDDWYRKVYVPHYEHEHPRPPGPPPHGPDRGPGHRGPDHHGHGHGHDKHHR